MNNNVNRVVDTYPPGDDRPIRVLHILGVMNRAGVETWLLHMLRAIDRDRFTMDFAVESDEQGDYDEEIRRLGSSIHCVGPRTRPGYGARLKKVIGEHGPYDVVHSHHNHYSGRIMRLAHRAKVATRITHSHTDSSVRDKNGGLIRKLYVRLMHHWIRRYATECLAASAPAAASLFGPDWREQNSCRVMHCSVDLTPFAEEHDHVAARGEFGIPENSWVVGHVGRMVAVKNHRLMIDTFAELLPQVDNAYLLLVGDGPLRGEIEQRARELGVIDRVRFAGNRKDVPRILCAAIDAFVFPSKYEGLPLALLEAQAAGLPCVVSDAVAEEADAIPEQITRLSIREPWAPTLLGLRGVHRRRLQSLAQMLRSDFAIQQGVAALQHTYLQAHTEAHLGDERRSAA